MASPGFGDFVIKKLIHIIQNNEQRNSNQQSAVMNHMAFVLLQNGKYIETQRDKMYYDYDKNTSMWIGKHIPNNSSVEWKKIEGENFWREFIVPTPIWNI